MGTIYKQAKRVGLIKDVPLGGWSGEWSFLNGGPINWTSALIDSGKSVSQITLASMSGDEVNAICSKLDQIYSGITDPRVANMVAEELNNILATVCAVKYQTQSSFGGILAQGTQLEIWPLRAKDVGGVILNPAVLAATGVYAQAIGAAFSWLNPAAGPMVAGTLQALIPAQVMWQYAGMIYLGFTEHIAVPKIEAVRFTLAGTVAVSQPCTPNLRSTWGDDHEASFTRLEKPVIIPPLKTQRVDVMPFVAGDTDFEPIALVIAQSQNKAF
jgi:hypothetical protein